MAWKRGTQNNQAGAIRKGHIREFLLPTSRESSISIKLKIIDKLLFPNEESYLYVNDMLPYALINFESLPSEFKSTINIDNEFLYLHAHDHPTSILACKSSSLIPMSCVFMNEVQLLNSKVCVGEIEDFTIYQGDSFAYDAREGCIGDTKIRSLGLPTILKNIIMTIRPKLFDDNDSKTMTNELEFHYHDLLIEISKYFQYLIISLEEVYVIAVKNTSGNYISIICTVNELHPNDHDDDDPNDIMVENERQDDPMSYVQQLKGVPDNYRGFVNESSQFYFIAPNHSHITITHNRSIPQLKRHSDIVDIITLDNEIFPVRRQLLRPCIALTSIVQAGRGKYNSDQIISEAVESESSHEEESTQSCQVNLDACTFDRVLLYLEHEACHEEFKFDPLLAQELHAAGTTLRIQGLIDACEKVLGSFQERVRKTFIKYNEVVSRNQTWQDRDNKIIVSDTDRLKLKETLLILNGMVLDVTRWLEEHPGGSTIIPTQALNIDCTVFFEIYHASKQSFLYLKEFYIGELDPNDYQKLLDDLPPNTPKPSQAFIEQIHDITSPWRLSHTDIIRDEDIKFKSF